MSVYNRFFPYKALLYPDKIQGILNGTFLSPVTLHIYPTNNCNGKCPYCIMKKEQEFNTSLRRETFQEAIKSANRMKVKSIHIAGGGEPLLYKHLSDLEEFEGTTFLSTNGSLLSMEELFLFDHIRISINAGTAQMRKELMGLDDWDKLVSNIKMMMEVKSPSQTVGLAFVLDYRNVEDIYNFFKLVDETRVDYAHIRPAWYPKGSKDEAKIKDIVYHMQGIRDKANLYNGCFCRENSKTKIYLISEKFDGYWGDRGFSKCQASPLQAVLSATGEMIICLDMFIRFGDLNKQMLDEVWGSEEHKEAIKKIDIEKCPRCVMTKANEIIEHVFENNEILRELI